MMQQALHILRKDIRFLRGDILLVLLLVALMAFVTTHFPPAGIPVEVLVALALNYLVARAVHAEAIPGHNQFWITRPYRWQSLLVSKLLFVLLFVNLPLLVAQFYAITAEGFPLISSLPGLLWSQLLMIVCLTLPMMCLASLTSGLIPFMVTEMILLAEVLICEGLVNAHLGWNQFLPGAKPGPPEADWLRDFIVMAIVTVFAAVVLYSQYKTRNSEASRKLAVQGLVLAGVVYLVLPWPFLLAVQSALSPKPFDGSSLQVQLDPVKNAIFPPGSARGVNAEGTIVLPLRIPNVPAAREVAVDAANITLEAPDGKTWSSGIIAAGLLEGQVTLINTLLHVDPVFLSAEHARPLTVRARLYLTFFGDSHSVTIPIQSAPANTLDGLQCSIGYFDQLYCRSVFRWPRRRVYAKTGENGLESYVRTISYSPFPAALGFNPTEQHSFSSTPAAKQAVITTKAPLSHFSFDATLPGVVLDEYTADAKRKALQAPSPGVHFSVTNGR